MWMQAGRMLDADDSFLLYKMDTHGGQSGCPVILWEDGNDFTVVGIHTGHVGTANRAVRIASAVFEQLMSWKNQT
jgi:V8-like Glu-specific endopeptidase